MNISIAKEIEILREKLNKLLKEEVDYNKIYKVSVELDELIFKYSNQQ